MASIQSIAKAQTAGKLLKAITGIEPEYIYYDDYVQVTYKKENLPEVQRKVSELIANTSSGSDVKIDYVPIVGHVAIKKIIPYALGLLFTGYIIGKL
ncbi:MAG: hypothetical protein PHT24_06240 [Endomicrobiaceae bacterium]|jgi:hypothetical protein|nr:hypothetical protein [Endomicrobiaceae bacterium]